MGAAGGAADAAGSAADAAGGAGDAAGCAADAAGGAAGAVGVSEASGGIVLSVFSLHQASANALLHGHLVVVPAVVAAA